MESLITATRRACLRSAFFASGLCVLAAVGAIFSAPAAAQAGNPATQQPEPADHPPEPLGLHAAEPKESLPSLALSPQILFQYLAAEVAAQRGDLSAATATMLSLARQTRDPRLARRAAEFALAARSLEYAMQAVKLWRELSPESTLAARTLETLLLSSGRLDEAEPLIAQRLERARADGSSAEFWRQLQFTLFRVSDKSAALALIERLAAGDAKSAPAWLAVANVAAVAGQQEKAVEESRRALELDPDSQAAVVTVARLLSTSPEGRKQASEALEKFLARQPKSVEVRFAYARLLAADGQADSARQQMKLALEQDPENPALLFAGAQLAYQGHQLDDAKAMLQRYLALPPTVSREESNAYLFLAQIAEDQGKITDAIGWLEKVDGGDQWLAATIRRALLLGKLGRLDEARKLLHDTSVSTSRQRVQIIAGEAQLLRETGHDAQAFEVLDHALVKMPDDPDLLYDQAMAAEKINRLDVMEASLRRLIKLRPDNAHAYNALGYTFADRNIRLDEARELIKKALALAPDDAHIIDSMGWLEYRQGNLPAAIDYLQRAYKLQPEPDVAAHLGEVFWKTGRADEARRVWREAKLRQPDNETLRETLLRLDVRL